MSGGRVLVVEDNPLNLKLLRDVLVASGYDVVTATSGEDALELAVSAPPQLVLMDLQLPGIDGAETMRRLRAGPTGPDVPVVAVTAFAMVQDQLDANRAGFDAYVEKPVSVRALLDLVRSLLDRATP
ncbi:response regulator [Ornithinimicrobium cerasi]|uniref:Two-component system, cell cycle response regulator DivK n=1 Tax=Ornithinimicrobium cerasi TaxID=2248773 RepID=A0A285VN38_9MICO|nr:response regulator [Ornithinimicrobium cerasi]SOC55479.1 two-component system, cell cycle response regulator DivK [Ornithinimicrobium cerasi]